MSRSQQAQVQQNAQGMLTNENANANSAINTALPGYQAIAANPGYTPAQQTAITNATLGGIGAAFGNANQGAVNQAARTNNTAGLTSTEDALARQRMQTSAQAGAQNQETFANNAQQQRLAALGGLGGLYGQTLSGANSTLGTEAGNSKTPGFWDTFGNAFAGALGKGLVPGADINLGGGSGLAFG